MSCAQAGESEASLLETALSLIMEPLPRQAPCGQSF